MSYTSILIPLYLFNISVSSNLNIEGAPLRHFKNKDNMFLVSKCKLILSLASSYRIRESKFLMHYLIRCPLSSYSNLLYRNLIQSTNRSSESRYS
jgi:hypothetical protein